jgi:hypothetical protein
METQSTLHESMDFVQGRKNVGGKLEVKARIRQPVIEHQANMVGFYILFWTFYRDFFADQPKMAGT